MPTKETTYCPTHLTKKEMDVLKEDLKHFGYLLPTSDEELEEFEKIYGTTQVMFPEHLKDPSFLHKKKENKLKPVKQVSEQKRDPKSTTDKGGVVKPFGNAYFKKLVLAAEIATQLHNEYTFGHVKFVKILYLCEEVCQMQLNSNYGKYAAGPLDPKSMYSIDAEFKNRKWFDVTKSKYGYKYKALENAEVYKKYYLNYFSSSKENIDFIVNLFRTTKTDFTEIIATLFAVWKESLSKNLVITNSLLIKEFFEWSKEKKRFREEDLLRAISWMKQKNIVPIS